MKITLKRGDIGGTYLIVHEDGRDVLMQLDYDAPGVASAFGWSPANIAEYEVRYHSRISNSSEVEFAGTKQECQEYLDDPDNHSTHLTTALTCNHTGTDGTIDCKDCGVKAIAFINDAQQYLDDHIGDEADDPGYFDDEDE